MSALFNKTLLGLLMAFTLASCSIAQENGNSIRSIEPKAFHEELRADSNYILIDVRTPREVAQGYIGSAVNYNLYATDFEKKLKAIEKGKKVMVYCARGGRSMKAAQKLKDLGFENIVNLEGGYTAWKTSGIKAK